MDIFSSIDLASHVEAISNTVVVAHDSIASLYSVNPHVPTQGTSYNSTVNGSLTSSSGYNFSPVATWTFSMAIIGAILLFWCFVPGFVNTIRTRDTSQMSLLMWTITFFGLVFLVLFYALGMGNSIAHLSASTDAGTLSPAAAALSGAATYSTHAYTGEVSSQFTVVFTCEGLSLLMSTYVFLFKIYNMIKSRSLGITEAEYCEQLLKKAQEKEAAKRASRESVSAAN